MEKLTDNEIIKALERCGNIVDSTCKGCAYHETYNASCVVRLMCEALDLINRQKAEIERLQKENERFADIGKLYSEIRAEAIKGFWEKLKKEKVTHKNFGEMVYVEDGDNLVKEMVGD